MKLICKNCGNDRIFIANYFYSCEVDNNGNKIEPEEMNYEPEYYCEKCGSGDIEIIFE